MSSHGVAATPKIFVRPRAHPRAWVWAEWLIYLVIILLVVARFFTERIVLLPRVVNAIDLVAVPLLVPICLLWIVLAQAGRLRGRYVFILCFGFGIAWLVAWLLNSNDTHWLGATLFLVGLVTPILFYLVLINLGLNEHFVQKMVRLLEILLALNLIIGTYDIVTGIGTGADFVFGTFGVNPNQLAFFLAIMLAYLAAHWRYEGLSLLGLLVLIWTGVVFLLCGFQTLWAMLAFAIGFVHLILAHWSRRLALLLAVAVLVPIFVLSSINFERFDFLPILEQVTSRFDELGKVQLLRSVPEVWASRPWALLFGVGPGTFNSRAFRSIAIVPYQGGAGTTDVAAAIVQPFFQSELSAKYITPYFERGFFLLSGSNTDGPFTSYVSIPIEVGMVGAFAIFGIYVWVGLNLVRSLRRTKNLRERTLAAWGLTALVLVLGIAAVDNFLEVTRYTLLVWLAVALWQIYRSRYVKME